MPTVARPDTGRSTYVLGHGEDNKFPLVTGGCQGAVRRVAGILARRGTGGLKHVAGNRWMSGRDD